MTKKSLENACAAVAATGGSTNAGLHIPALAHEAGIRTIEQDNRAARIGTGEEGVDLGKIYDYDLILLDLNLPDMNGMDVLRNLRVGRINTPIMILSGSTEIDTKVKTLGGGADDYLTKPFHTEELLARLRALLREAIEEWDGMDEAFVRRAESVIADQPTVCDRCDGDAHQRQNL